MNPRTQRDWQSSWPSPPAPAICLQSRRPSCAVRAYFAARPRLAGRISRVASLRPGAFREAPSGRLQFTLPMLHLERWSCARQNIAGQTARLASAARATLPAPMPSCRVCANGHRSQPKWLSTFGRAPEHLLQDCQCGCTCTGSFVMPCTKLELRRSSGPTTSTARKRGRISSQRMRSCISASRLPIQR